MAVFPLSRIIRCTTDWSLANGGLAQNVFHMGVSAGAPTQTHVDNAAERMASLYTDTLGGFRLMGAISEDVSVVQVVARTLDPANPLETQLSVGENGDQTSEPLPLETAGVTTLYSELASRRGRGRTFLPGIATVESDNGLWLEASRAAINDVYTEWLAIIPVGGVDLTLVVFSATNASGRDVLSFATRSIFHHQKRRNS